MKSYRALHNGVSSGVKMSLEIFYKMTFSSSVPNRQLLSQSMKTTFSIATTFPLKLKRKADIDRFLPENGAACLEENDEGLSLYPTPIRNKLVK